LIEVSLKNPAGDIIAYTMTAIMLAKSINLAVALFNSQSGRFFSDIGAI
jgi:hypothetical protein